MSALNLDKTGVGLYRTWPGWLDKGTAYLAAALAVWYGLVFAGLAGLRLFYPYELEWIEGAYIDEARWIAAGHFPYAAPSIFFIPTSKTPLFFYLAAGMMKLLGEGPVAPRLISVLATAGCFGLLYQLVRRETGLATAGIAAAGVFAASYRFAGAWMDLAKTDALFLFLTLAAVYCVYRWRGSGSMVAGGILLIMAYFTKQMALPVALALAPVSLAATRGRTWLWWAIAGGLGLAAAAVLDQISSGWFSFYTFQTSIHHERTADVWLFWRAVLPKFWPALLLAAGYGGDVLARTRLRPLQWPEQPWQLCGFGLALVLASWSIFFKTWTYDNGFLPACLGLALLAGLACGELARRARPGLAALGWLLLVVQFGLLYYNPAAQLPTRQDRQAADAFVARLAVLPGEVFVFNHGYYNYLAGKTSYLHSAPFGDVIGGEAAPVGSELERRRELARTALKQAIVQQQFAWVITDKPAASWAPDYLLVEDLSVGLEGFYPITGARTRPQSLMARNPVAHGGDLPLGNPIYNRWFGEGWSDPETWGRRASGPRAAIQLALEAGRGYQLSIETKPGCVAEQPSLDSIGIGWNEQELGRLAFLDCSPGLATFDLSALAIIPGADTLWLDIPLSGLGGTVAPNVAVTRITFNQK